jgi:arylsulfatase A-like enzyme
MYAKHNVYEEAARVPLIIVPPAFDPEKQYTNSLGKISNTPVEMLDLYPTIMKMAGIGDPTTFPVLENPLTHPRMKRFMISQNPAYASGIMSYSLRTWWYRYVIHIQGGATGGLIIGRELYHYPTDSPEINNFINNPYFAEVVSTFEAEVEVYKSLRWTGINGLVPFDAPAGDVSN